MNNSLRTGNAGNRTQGQIAFRTGSGLLFQAAGLKAHIYATTGVEPHDVAIPACGNRTSLEWRKSVTLTEVTAEDLHVLVGHEPDDLCTRCYASAYPVATERPAPLRDIERAPGTGNFPRPDGIAR